MARPLKATLSLLAYDGTTTNNPKDATKIEGLVEETDVTELSRQQIAIADAVTDQAITLPDANCEYLMIHVDQTVSVKVNGSATAQTLTPKAAGTKTPVLFLRGAITALTVTNASGNTANFDIIAVNV